MPKPASLRAVRCYHCGASFDVGSRAITVSCPKCFQRVAVEDVHFKASQFGGDVRTCGVITVTNKSLIQAKTLQASEGVEIDGTVEARLVAGDSVHVTAGSRLRGDCNARTIRIERGATIEGGYFRIGTRPSDAPAR